MARRGEVCGGRDVGRVLVLLLLHHGVSTRCLFAVPSRQPGSGRGRRSQRMSKIHRAGGLFREGCRGEVVLWPGRLAYLTTGCRGLSAEGRPSLEGAHDGTRGAREWKKTGGCVGMNRGSDGHETNAAVSVFNWYISSLFVFTCGVCRNKTYDTKNSTQQPCLPCDHRPTILSRALA